MKKNNENEELKGFEKFKWKWKNVSGYKELMKLLGYIVFFVFLIILMNIYKPINDNNESLSNKPVEANQVPTYEENKQEKSLIDYINNLENNYQSVKLTATLDNTYIINYNNKNNVYEGYIESKENIKHFILDSDIIYEVKEGKKEINENVLLPIKSEYINISKLSDILKKSKLLKQEDNDEINYIKKDNNKEIEVKVKNDKIIKINIMEGENSYTYYFE